MAPCKTTADIALWLVEAMQVIMEINRSKGWVVHPVSQTADKNVIQENPSTYTDGQKCVSICVATQMLTVIVFVQDSSSNKEMRFVINDYVFTWLNIASFFVLQVKVTTKKNSILSMFKKKDKSLQFLSGHAHSDQQHTVNVHHDSRKKDFCC